MMDGRVCNRCQQLGWYQILRWFIPVPDNETYLHQILSDLRNSTFCVTEKTAKRPINTPTIQIFQGSIPRSAPEQHCQTSSGGRGPHAALLRTSYLLLTVLQFEMQFLFQSFISLIRLLLENLPSSP